MAKSKKATKKRARSRGLSRPELAKALDVSGSAVDRLIGAGLKPVATRGRAKLYSLDQAKRLRSTLSKNGTKYGKNLLELFRAQAQEALDRIYELEATYVEPARYVKAWTAYVRWAGGKMKTWPKALERCAGKPSSSWETPARDHLRPLMAKLEADSEKSPKWKAVAALFDPPPTRALKPVEAVADAKQQLISVRAELSKLRGRVRREKWTKREDLDFALGDATSRSLAVWWSSFPALISISRRPTDPAVWRKAAEQARGDALAALEVKKFRFG